MHQGKAQVLRYFFISKGEAELSFRLPVVLFYRIDDSVQQLLLLMCGAVQRFQSLYHSGCMDIGDPLGQDLFPLGSFGVIHNDAHRRHAFQNKHLLMYDLEKTAMRKLCGICIYLCEARMDMRKEFMRIQVMFAL